MNRPHPTNDDSAHPVSAPISCFGQQISDAEVREYIAKLLCAGLLAVGCAALVLVFEYTHSHHYLYGGSAVTSLVMTLALVLQNRFLGSSQFYADVKWILFFDVCFSFLVVISHEINTPFTSFIFNIIRLHISAVVNTVFAILAVRLLWCFRDANGAFLRMPPLNAIPFAWRAIWQRPFPTAVCLTGIAASVVVGAAVWAVFTVAMSLSLKDAYFPSIIILAAGAFPCGVGFARAYIAREKEKRAIAQAEKAAQANAAAMAMARELEAQKRAEAEQVAEAAKAELGRVQELFQGFALRNMRLETDVTNAAHAAKLVDRQLAHTRAANRWALAKLHRTNHALAEAECQLAALREEALQLHTALQKQGEHVIAWGLETMRPSAKITAEEVRAVIAALDPDSPTYSHGIKAAAKVLVLLQTAPMAEKIMNNKAILHHFKTELAEFMRQAGILNQYGEPNGTLMANAIHVAMARPGNRADR